MSTQSIIRTQDAYRNNPYLAKLSSPERQEIVERIKELDLKIQIWKRLAEKGAIDISAEKNLLATARVLPQKFSENSKEDLSFLLMERFKSKVCERIIMKVRAKFKPPEETLEALCTKLRQITMNCFAPLQRLAKKESVDISQEMEILKAANLATLQKLKEERVSFACQEVIKRRLIILREQSCIRILGRIYQKRIENFAVKAVTKNPFDEEKNGIIDGIKIEALAQIPRNGSLQTAKERCRAIFVLFKKNINLLERDPEAYHKLADREVFRRGVIASCDFLKMLASGKKVLMAQIEGVKAIALRLLDSNECLETITKRLQRSYDLIRRTLPSKVVAYPCGFTLPH